MRCNSHTLTLISASASYTAATSMFLQEWQMINLPNTDRIPMGKKIQLLTMFYLQVLGKLHAFSELLEVMMAHSSE